MSLPHIILAMLQFGPQTGYDLDKQMERYVFFVWNANQSQVYRTLYKLNDKGWVEIEHVIQEDSPNKKVYHLTESGAQELHNWLATPGHEIQARNPFIAQIMWGGYITISEQIHVFEERLAHVEEMIVLLESRADFKDGYTIPLPPEAFIKGVSRNALSLDYGIRNYQWQKEWLEDTIARLKKVEAAEK